MEVKKGWTIPHHKHERSVRDRENGLWGQGIWYQLKRKGFTHKDDIFDHLTDDEERVRNWLIVGYLETDREHLINIGVIKEEPVSFWLRLKKAIFILKHGYHD